jgi:hypothetical protein
MVTGTASCSVNVGSEGRLFPHFAKQRSTQFSDSHTRNQLRNKASFFITVKVTAEIRVLLYMQSILTVFSREDEINIFNLRKTNNIKRYFSRNHSTNILYFLVF